MKTITIMTWYAIGLYAIGTLLVILADKARPEGMGAVIVILMYLLLAVLAVLNFLPYKWTRIAAFVMCAYPIVSAVYYSGKNLFFGENGVIAPDYQTAKIKEEALERANGSYYFKDPVRRDLASAISEGDIDHLKKALEEPVPNLNASGEDHVTLLDFALMQSVLKPEKTVMECLNVLLDKGALIETEDSLRKPAHVQALEYNPTMLHFFLERKADPNAVDKVKNTPILYSAIFIDSHDIYRMAKIRLLLEHGADPNAMPPASKDGPVLSALSTAADMQHWDVCNLLLDHGADPTGARSDKRDLRKTIARHAEEFERLDQVPSEEFTKLKERLAQIP